MTVQNLLNVHKGKLRFIWLKKKDKLILLKCKVFSMNLNAQHVNGLTPFDLTI